MFKGVVLNTAIFSNSLVTVEIEKKNFFYGGFLKSINF
jgi:hypothetical protein